MFPFEQWILWITYLSIIFENHLRCLWIKLFSTYSLFWKRGKYTKRIGLPVSVLDRTVYMSDEYKLHFSPSVTGQSSEFILRFKSILNATSQDMFKVSDSSFKIIFWRVIELELHLYLKSKFYLISVVSRLIFINSNAYLWWFCSILKDTNVEYSVGNRFK